MKKKIIVGIGVVLFIIGGFYVLMLEPENSTTIEAFVDGRDTRDVIEELENDLDERIAGGVYQDGIELTYGNESMKIYDEQDEFYVSIAPYINSTHG